MFTFVTPRDSLNIFYHTTPDGTILIDLANVLLLVALLEFVLIFCGYFYLKTCLDNCD